MIHHHFCSDISKEFGEELIGTAPSFQTYVLIECPLPWASNAFESKAIPQGLRELISSVQSSKLPIQFLLVNRGYPFTYKLESRKTHLVIYSQLTDDFHQGYQRQEWIVESLDDVAYYIELYLMGHLLPVQTHSSSIRDLLVCVHGSRDKCCAKYGLPFYRETRINLNKPEYRHVRVWQTSHIGGHRFAPTLIDMPTGRYYGRLTQKILHSILSFSGDLGEFHLVYRGWSILPPCLQIAERELIQKYGWKWFENKVSYRIISQNLAGSWIQAEFAYQQLDGQIYVYRFELEKDIDKSAYKPNSCSSSKISTRILYRIKSIDKVDQDYSLKYHHHRSILYLPLHKNLLEKREELMG